MPIPDPSQRQRPPHLSRRVGATTSEDGERISREVQARRASAQQKRLTGKYLVQLYQHHDARWRRATMGDVSGDPRRQKASMESTIYVYLFTKFYQMTITYKSEKDRVKEHIKRWHPEK
ncbi:hypothetical protein M378DRAFT_168719 [Amanita muscaria Koide BX008]|uniref:Uncharacterized protein n=1 Tax=Amanita muscaria (strain Koide BX008) TaxID=946122 RepID=A0A0C2WF02_AMAMK|nr:hypothetical protein M378DRAFT_168719 [Amanita muscaria Koide BX008]